MKSYLVGLIPEKALKLFQATVLLTYCERWVAFWALKYFHAVKAAN